MNKLVLGVMASGRGSNLQSILDAIEKGTVPARVSVVITDKPEAKALDRARAAGIPAVCVNRKEYDSRESFEHALIEVLRAHGVELVVLAGFMRILTSVFVQAFKQRILNIHPSILPSFTGADAHSLVLEYGAKVSGCTVHFVDEGMDTGPIILQATVPVMEDDDHDSLAARVLVEEHKIYPEAIRLYAEGRLTIEGRKVRIDRN